MLKAAAEGVTPEELIGRVGAERRATSPPSASASTTTTRRTPRRIAASPCACTARSRRPGTSRAAACGRPTTRRPACSCPTATSRAPARAAARRTSTATAARTAAPPTRPSDLIDPVSVVSGTRPVRARVRAHLLPAREFRGDAAAVDAIGLAAARGREQARRMVRRGPSRLGHLARRALLRLRDPGRARQVLLRLARRADRLHGELRELLQAQRRSTSSDWWKPGSAARAPPLHRQGHPVLPRAVLAGDARGRGLAQADRRARPRLPDRQRREDVEVARHVRHGAHATSTTCRPTTSATSSRRSSVPASTTST